MSPNVETMRHFGIRDEIWITGIGLFVAIVIYIIFPITFFPDSDQYYNFAKAMLGQQSANTSSFRGLGVPILLILSGVFHLDTFKVFVLLQLAMAIAAPIILYRIIANWNRKYAFVISILTTLSLLTFGFAKAILSEQAYLLALLLLVSNAIRLQQRRLPVDLYYQTLLLLALMMLKPISNLLFILCLAYDIFLFRKKFLHLVIAFSSLGVVVFAMGRYSAYLFRNAPVEQRRQHMAGSILFYNLYLSSDIEGEKRDLTKIKSLRIMLDSIQHFYVVDAARYAKHLDDYRSNPEAFKFLFKPYINNPVALSDAVIQKPTKYYYSYLNENVNNILGNEYGDWLMLTAALEIMHEYPGLAISYISRNVIAFASGRHISYSYYVARAERITEYFPPSLEPLTWEIPPPSGVLPNALEAELAQKPINSNPRLAAFRDAILVNIWGWLFVVLKPFLFIGTILSAIMIRCKEYYPAVLFASLIVVYHMAIVCVFNVPLNRYLIPTLPLEIFCTTIVAISLRSRFLKHKSPATTSMTAKL